jgi:hypothetical protein
VLRIRIRIDPHNFGKPDPHPHQSGKPEAVEAHHGDVETHNGAEEAHSGALEGCNFDEEPDLDPHQIERSDPDPHPQ